MVQGLLSIQLFRLHSPSTLHTCFSVHSPYSYFVYTLQAHVRFNIFKFSPGFIFSYLHSPHMFQCSLPIQLFRLHSPSTLHTCFSVHSPYSYFVYTLQAHVRFNLFKFSPGFIFSYFHSPHMFQCSLSIQVFGLLSKHMLGSKFFDFQGITFSSYLRSPHMFLHAVVFSTLQKSLFIFFFFVPCLLCTHV